MKSLLAKITGEPPAFPLEARIFNAICLISALGLFAGLINNLLIGIPQIVILIAPVFACVLLCYYYSRFKLKLNTAVTAYLVATNVLIIANFRFNSGINGPVLLLFLLSYFLTISIVPKKQYWFWIALNLGIVFTLLILEYNYPRSIINTYTNSRDRFIDFGFVYALIAFIIFFVTTSIRKSYHTEKELVEQKATELENANETKDKLFSILAHDLRAPLSSIQNYLEILSEFRLDEDEKLSIKKDLLKSTQNTQQLLSNLLLWSKAQMQGVNAKLVKVNLSEVLAGTFEIHRTIAAEKGIELTNKLNSSITIMADTEMLQLIVRNLINNAIKFTQPGGEITVTDVAAGDTCTIIIKDNGLGIPHDRQDHIFSLKADSTFGTKNEKGVGLGLVLCKEFVELQNGTIYFESMPGKGTIFYVNFKLSDDMRGNFQLRTEKSSEKEANL